jgi:thiamine-monophosphate kinase
MKAETVRDVGEFGLIEALQGALPKKVVESRRLRMGIGDDAAVWRQPRDESLLVTTDSLVEGIHFRLDWTDWRSLGHKSLAANVSDIAAMGGVPKLATVTLGLRGTERVTDLQALYRGLGALAAKQNMLVAGGDLVASPHCLAIHLTVIGTTRWRGRYLTRTGARPGDVIGVSGTLGAAAAGYRLLREGAHSPRRQATTADLLIAAHLRPIPRVRLGQVLLHTGAHAAMDVSDGLLGDLPKMLAASGVATCLEARAIPVAAAVRALFPDDWFDLATRGGEDYELLFTAPPDAFAKITAAAAEVEATVTAIGEIVHRSADRPPLTMRGLDGVEREVAAGAFDHFA